MGSNPSLGMKFSVVFFLGRSGAWDVMDDAVTMVTNRGYEQNALQL